MFLKSRWILGAYDLYKLEQMKPILGTLPQALGPFFYMKALKGNL